MTKRLTKSLAIMVILITTVISSAAAQYAQPSDKLVRIAVFRNAQPVIFVDDQGDPAGIYPEILERILSEAGFEVEFIIFSTFQEAFATAVAGKVDIMPALIKTEERQKIFDFGNSSFLVSWSQVFVSEDSRIDSVFDLKDKKVGVQTDGQNGLNFIEMMHSFEIPFEQIDINTFDEITEAIVDGKIDAGIFFSTYFHDELKIKPTNIVFSPSNSYIAVRKGRSNELLKTIDSALEKAKADPNSFYYDIMRKYRLLYHNDYLPLWLIILVISLGSLIIIAVVFIILLRYLIKRVTHNLILEKQRAEESDRLKTGFLSRISHELRTPLNGIMGMHALLQLSELDENHKMYLNFAGEASRNLHTIIQELLDLNESNKPEFQVHIQETDIGATVESAVKFIKLYAEKNQIGIKFKTVSQLLWMTDRKRLQQILIQLLLNAVDFSEKGMVTIEIIMGRTLDIKIKDSGIGFDESKYEEIFIPFHQLENPFTRQQGGLGIGLSIVKQICEKINAEIIVNSKPELGSEFIIRLL
ncbi:MAG TPA: hypothetical protein DCO79_07400 [Spirochaeta sp.]|nr:hypothetical protein [Spirochaeta sp.]